MPYQKELTPEEKKNQKLYNKYHKNLMLSAKT